MKKICISFILVILMIFTLAAAVAADECNAKDVTSGKTGTLTTADLCSSVTNPTLSKSAFDKFGFYKNDSSSSGAKLIYSTDTSDSVMSSIYPDVGSGRYVYGVYTPKKDYDNYNVKFMAQLDNDMKKIAQEGALQIYVSATTVNKNGTFNDETGVIGFKAYDKNGKVVMEHETNTDSADGTKNVEISWKTLPKSTEKIMIIMRSVRHGLGTQPKNRSKVQDPRVYLRDVSKPYVTEVGIVDDEDTIAKKFNTTVKGDWVQRTNNAGKTYKIKNIGDEILYYVKFNEKISVNSGLSSAGKRITANANSVKLGIEGRNGTSYTAGYIGYSGDTIYFKTTIQDASNYLIHSGEGGMSTFATAKKFYLEGPYICDYSGNQYAGGAAASISSKWKSSDKLVDDTLPGLARDMIDENGVYPAKYLTTEKFNLYGALPEELIGTPSTGASGNANIQPTLFSADGEKGMIFRIVINEEILKSSLNGNTKLLLNIFDSGSNLVGNAYAYLVAARYSGTNTKSPYGIKDNMMTEMFFRYVPTADAAGGREVYTVKPALWNNNVEYKQYNYVDGVSVSEGLLTTGTTKTSTDLLKTTSGYSVELDKRSGALFGSHLKGLSGVKVDTKAPQFVEDNLPDSWTASIPSYSKLYFSEGDDISYDGVKISIWYEDSGSRKNVRFSVNGSVPSETILFPTGYDYSSGYYFVSLDGVSFPDGTPSDREMYIEYTISDRAGNTSTNKGEKNIVLMIDTKGPIVNGSTATVDGTYATVEYDVVDEGVAKLGYYIYYRVEKIGEVLDTTSHNTAYDNGNQSISISGEKNSYDTWRVWANFGDSLGNRTKVDGSDSELLYTPSDEIEMADRYFKLGIESESVVAKSHKINLSNFTISDNESDYTINLYYKWVKGSTNNSNENYKKLSFTDFNSVKDFNFADEDIIREFIYGKIPAGVKNIDKEYPIVGEYTFIAYAELLPEEEMQYNIIQTVYFDKTAPTANIKVYELDTADGPSHSVRYYFEDDAAAFKSGYYVKDGNISKDYEDTYLRIYADGKVVHEMQLIYRNNSLTYDLNDCDFLKGGKKVKYEFTVTDKFGNRAVYTTDEYVLDFVNPEISDFTLEGSKNLKLVEDGEIPLYAIASFTDIRSISVTVSDNMDKRLDITHLQGEKMKNYPANTDGALNGGAYERKYVYSNPISADFEPVRRDDDILVYRFTIYVVDDWGNSASRYFDVISDLNNPGVSVLDEGNTDATFEDYRDIRFVCHSEPYEWMYRDNDVLGGIQFKIFALVDGEQVDEENLSDFAEIIEQDGYDYVTVRVYNNCKVVLRVTDPFGHYEEVSVTVDNFDRFAPVVELDADSVEQTPEQGDAKYGSMTVKITDNVEVSAKAAAIVPIGVTPTEEDYFTGEYIFEAGENNGENVTEGPLAPYATAKFEGNTISYSALPEGTYGFWIKAVDSAGNITETRVAEITSDNTGAALVSTVYTPDKPTAGQVIVTVNTDIPVARMYSAEEEGSIGAMFDYIEEQRLNGFTYYNKDGEKITENDVDKLIELYNSIKAKYDAKEEVADYEKEIFKNLADNSSYDPYGELLNFYSSYDIPSGDILDYLHNLAFYSMDNDFNIDPDSPRLTDYAYEYIFDLIAEYGFEEWGKAMHQFVTFGLMSENDTELSGYTDFEGTSIENMNVLEYPTAFDEYMYNCFIPAAFAEYLLKDAAEYVNPFYAEEGISFIPEDLLIEIFGDEIPEAFGEPAEYEGVIQYANPFLADSNPELLTYADLKAAGFEDWIDCFEIKNQYYRNPFIEGDDVKYSESDMEKLFNAIGLLQKAREITVEKIADKYAYVFLDYSKQEYTTSNVIKFRDNVEKELKFIDYTGQILSVPIKIDWIDHSLPHIPEDSIVFSHRENPVYTDYYGQYYPVNYEYVDMTVSVPQEGIYEEYYILVSDLPEGAVAFAYDEYGYIIDINEGDEYCKGFTLEVEDNGVIEFTMVNPNANSNNTASQIVIVDFFDRTPPTADLVFTPAKPANGNKVNTDVSVSIENVSDNRTDYEPYFSLFRREVGETEWEEMEVDYWDYEKQESVYYTYDDNDNPVVWDGRRIVFTENTVEYEYKFEVVDEAGNTSDYEFTVDYIDKSHVEFEVKLFCGDEEIEVELSSSNTTDATAAVYEYTVINDSYRNSPLTIEVYVKGAKVGSGKIGTDDSRWTFSYTAPHGNSASMDLTGFKFDTESPEGMVSYTLVQPGKGAMSYVEAMIKVFDEHYDLIDVQSVTGRLTDGTAITDADLDFVGYDDQAGSITTSMRFEANGFADIVFADEAGNQFLVQLSVSDIDRTVPRAYIEYSTTKPTNNDIQAMIFLTEPAEYKIIDSSNRVIADYTGIFSNVVYYTFKDNGNMFFQFRDVDGNETEALIAYVSNIDKTAPELRVVKVHRNKALDMEDNLVNVNGFATIELEAVSGRDTLDGEDDTIVMLNANQSKYHTVNKNGTYVFNFGDEAGNFGTISVVVDVIDDTAPTATVTGNPTSWTNTAPEITIRAVQTDDCDCDDYIVLNGEGHEEAVFSPTENGRYSYVLRDECGNTVTEYINVEFVDMVLPVITFEDSSDIYVYPGEFTDDIKAAFEKTVCTDEGGSGLASAGCVVDYGSFDQDVPGDYTVVFTVSDNAGNTVTATRVIHIIGKDDVFVLINDVLLIPGSQTTFWNGEELELSFLNAEKSGNKISYAFEKGFFNGAEMKGSIYKKLTTPDAKIKLEADEKGMYTLFVQTENRKTMVMYVFVAGSVK